MVKKIGNRCVTGLVNWAAEYEAEKGHRYMHGVTQHWSQNNLSRTIEFTYPV